jgi:hypothetical protein
MEESGKQETFYTPMEESPDEDQPADHAEEEEPPPPPQFTSPEGEDRGDEGPPQPAAALPAAESDDDSSVDAQDEDQGQGHEDAQAGDEEADTEPEEEAPSRAPLPSAPSPPEPPSPQPAPVVESTSPAAAAPLQKVVPKSRTPEAARQVAPRPSLGHARGSGGVVGGLLAALGGASDTDEPSKPEPKAARRKSRGSHDNTPAGPSESDNEADDEGDGGQEGQRASGNAEPGRVASLIKGWETLRGRGHVSAPAPAAPVRATHSKRPGAASPAKEAPEKQPPKSQEAVKKKSPKKRGTEKPRSQEVKVQAQGGAEEKNDQHAFTAGESGMEVGSC